MPLLDFPTFFCAGIICFSKICTKMKKSCVAKFGCFFFALNVLII